MPAGPVQYSLDGNIARILFDDGKANALSHDALDALSDALDLKAWGRNDDGQCGNGDATGDSVGDEPDEMGDNLDVVALLRPPTKVWTLCFGDGTASG